MKIQDMYFKMKIGYSIVLIITILLGVIGCKEIKDTNNSGGIIGDNNFIINAPNINQKYEQKEISRYVSHLTISIKNFENEIIDYRSQKEKLQQDYNAGKIKHKDYEKQNNVSDKKIHVLEIQKENAQKVLEKWENLLYNPNPDHPGNINPEIVPDNFIKELKITYNGDYDDKISSNDLKIIDEICETTKEYTVITLSFIQKTNIPLENLTDKDLKNTYSRRKENACNFIISKCGKFEIKYSLIYEYNTKEYNNLFIRLYKS